MMEIETKFNVLDQEYSPRLDQPDMRRDALREIVQSNNPEESL